MSEAERIVVKSEWMRDEVVKCFSVPSDKAKVILPNSARWIEDILETYQEVVEGVVE